MGSDPVYAGHGSAGIFYQWYHKGRLAGCLPVWYFCGSRTDTGDAADDRNYLSCKRCSFYEQKADDCEKSEFYSELWCDGYSLYR